MNNRREIIKKITTASMMLVFNIIFNRLFMVLSITPLNKIGLADVFTIFTSIYIGPLYGAIVGGFGDMLGALILPTGAINWILTGFKFVSGALPGLLHLLLCKIKNNKICQYISYGLVVTICILITIFVNTVPSIQIMDNFIFIFELWARILFPCLAFSLSIILFLFLHFVDKKTGKNSKYETWLIVIVYELSFPLILNTIAKSIFFNVNFVPIFIIQLLLFIIDVVLIVFILNILERVRKFSR